MTTKTAEKPRASVEERLQQLERENDQLSAEVSELKTQAPQRVEEIRPDLVELEKEKAAYAKKPFVGYFKVLRGVHIEGPPGAWVTYRGVRYGELKNPPPPKGQALRHKLRGQIVHSKKDLLMLNPANSEWNKKFERVEGPYPEGSDDIIG